MVGRKRPPATNVGGGVREMYRRYTVGRAIPRPGCAPAEPASVSPGAWEIASGGVRCKAKERRPSYEAACGGGGREEGGTAAVGKIREGRQVAPGGPGLPVRLETVRVP
jgi:hypothetical protein